jgi:hypothetical protein
MTKRIIALFMWGVFAAAPRADAAPIQVTSAEFNAAIVGLTTVVEDFEAFAIGVQPDPFTFANGTVTVAGIGDPAIVNQDYSCGVAGDGDACLLANGLWELRTISGLPAGTTLWAVTDFFALKPDNAFRITVTGNSGSSVFDRSTAAFYGFSDPTGLISISFQNLFIPPGFSNFSFDDIVTAGPAPIPEPASLTLLGLGLAGIGARRWQQRKTS